MSNSHLDGQRFAQLAHNPAAAGGTVFNVVHADVPMRKTDFVAGVYEFDAPAGETTVAVKITDMLGEEVLETQAA